MRRTGPLAALAALLLALPLTAQAHLVSSGLGPFYDGVLHLLLSPGDLAGLLAIALLAGLCGAPAARLTVIMLPVAWLLAGIVGLSLPGMSELRWLLIISFLIPGLLVAADAKLPPPAVAGLAVAFGALHGLFNGAALAAIGAGTTALLGIVVAVLLLAMLVSAAVIPLRALWARVAVRVAGSWIAAFGLLMLGWLAQGTA
ncbi:MAG: HupE/UreJ family protein [Marinobacter sp.]|nr:HupE/UreJ family protein [Marinobacter sp.]